MEQVIWKDVVGFEGKQNQTKGYVLCYAEGGDAECRH